MRIAAIFWLLLSVALAQTNYAAVSGIRGFIFGQGILTATAPTQTVHTYVVFPPAVDPSGGSNNTNFRTYVMPKIDGVTVNVNWAAIETTSPSGSCGANSDTQQTDLKGNCHTYNWTTPNNIDGALCATNSSSAGLGQWFCNNVAWGGKKKVNILVFGISTNPNTATPYYVTTSGWAALVNAPQQDVINTFLTAGETAGSCGSYRGSQANDMTKIGGNVVVTMSSQTMPPGLTNGDTVYIGDSSATTHTSPSTFNNLSGIAVSSVDSVNHKFSYACSACTGSALIPGSIVSNATSWPIPSETPYLVAFRAFAAAAIAHFSTGHAGSVVQTDQVAYMRVGYARGAEAIPECTQNWPGYVDQPTSEQAWLNFYADTSSYIMGVRTAFASTFHIQTPINEAGSPTLTDYGSQEAGISVQYVSGDHRVFGFGSQGMQRSDITNWANNIPCASDWCNQFNRYWAGGSSYKSTEFELQQLDCSDPTGTATGLACGENGNTSRTGDLRNLLPFATSRHMTILELYNQDALLAYDPNFCKINLSSCDSNTGGDTFSTLDTANQNLFYTTVGQGAGCNALGSGSGNCGYASAVDAVRGTH